MFMKKGLFIFLGQARVLQRSTKKWKGTECGSDQGSS